MKPYSESCEQNRQPIINILKVEFATCQHVLEIGSGTGQHAVYFAPDLPHLNWHTSDRSENHDAIKLWLEEARLENITGPHELDVDQNHWPLHDQIKLDAVFSANSTHIMGWSSVVNMFSGIGKLLQTNGVFCLYSPFNYNGQFTSTSNANFDVWLKQRDPQSGVRDFEAVNELAEQNNMQLKQDYEMPANNRMLVWIKK